MRDLNCTRCEGTGFINIDEDWVREMLEDDGPEALQEYLFELASQREHHGGCYCHCGHPPCGYCMACHDSEVSVCDCCGDGENWYHEPGQHDLDNKDVPFPECY